MYFRHWVYIFFVVLFSLCTAASTGYDGGPWAQARADAASASTAPRAARPRLALTSSRARAAPNLPPPCSQWATLTFFVIVSAMVDLMFGDDSQVRARRAVARGGVVC